MEYYVCEKCGELAGCSKNTSNTIHCINCRLNGNCNEQLAKYYKTKPDWVTYTTCDKCK